MTRTAWLLAIALAAIGCGNTDEVEPGLITVDSAQVRAPAAVDTASEAANPSTDDVLRAALEQLLRGPSNPQLQEHSWFSSTTAEALRSVTVDSEGHAVAARVEVAARVD